MPRVPISTTALFPTLRACIQSNLRCQRRDISASTNLLQLHIKNRPATVNTTLKEKQFLRGASPKSQELIFKMVCASLASSITSLNTLLVFYCVVCPIEPLVCISTFVASFFSGALGALEGSSGKGDEGVSSRNGKIDSANASSSANSTSFGCVIGLVTGLIAGYFTKSMEQPWRK